MFHRPDPTAERNITNCIERLEPLCCLLCVGQTVLFNFSLDATLTMAVQRYEITRYVWKG